jgi:ABC-type antimicrobial peptide transport system permease subunit
MNQPRRFSFKSFLPQTIVGLLIGGIIGLIIGIEIAPLIGSFLVEPSALILDPAAMLVGLLVIALCALGGAILGAYGALRMASRAKYR